MAMATEVDEVELQVHVTEPTSSPSSFGSRVNEAFEEEEDEVGSKVEELPSVPWNGTQTTIFARSITPKKRHAPVLSTASSFVDNISSVVNPSIGEDNSQSNITRNMLSVIMSCIYAVFMMTLGGVVHISSSTTEVVGYSTKMFASVMSILGIVWLLFFHVDLYRYKLAAMKQMKQQEELMHEMAERISTNTEFIFDTIMMNENVTCPAPPYRFLQGRHSGSFYLKIGLAVFCFGYVIYEGLQLGQHILKMLEDSDVSHCTKVEDLVMHTILPLFSFYQFFVTFKYSNVVISRFMGVARFGLMHLIASCLSLWFIIIFREAVEEHIHEEWEENENITNTTDVYRGGGPRCDDPAALSTNSIRILQYLYPFAIEFNLILAGVWFIMWQNIGTHHSGARSHPFQHSISRSDGEGEVTYRSNVFINVDCHAANKGLFAGLFVFFIIIVSVIVFFVAITTKGYEGRAVNIHSGQEGFLTLVSLIAVVVCYCQITHLDFNPHPVTFLDDALLFIPLPFYFINGILSTWAEMMVGNYIRAAVHLLLTVQVVAQTPFIIDGLRRCSDSSALRLRKPGRETVTFLIICNLIMWIVNTFELKVVERYHSQGLVLGKTTWMFISHITSPLMLFYRFHASVCLADIWKSAYEKGEASKEPKSGSQVS